MNDSKHDVRVARVRTDTRGVTRQTRGIWRGVRATNSATDTRGDSRYSTDEPNGRSTSRISYMARWSRSLALYHESLRILFCACLRRPSLQLPTSRPLIAPTRLFAFSLVKIVVHGEEWVESNVGMFAVSLTTPFPSSSPFSPAKLCFVFRYPHPSPTYPAQN